MFKQLRNRFLILNLIIISIMMIIAFISIYLITHSNVRNDINMEMNRLSDFNGNRNNSSQEPKSNSLQKHDLNSPQDPKPDNNINNNEEPPIERSISFTLTIDNKNKISLRSSKNLYAKQI